MTRKFISIICAAATLTAIADEKILFDFEDYSVGDKVAMRDYYSEDGSTASKAEITNDPTGKPGKVLHVKNASWNTLAELNLTGVTAEDIADGYGLIAFDLYRPNTETDHYRQFRCGIGDEYLHNVDNEYVFQGETGKWVSRTYPINPVNTTSDKFYIGFNSIDMEYYLDNIRIISTESDYDMTNEKHWLPGEGIADFGRIFAALRAAGYDGVYMMELGTHRDGSPYTPQEAADALKAVL